VNISTEQAPSRVEFVTVGPDQGGQRIDNFLLRHLKGVPKTLIYRILRKGEVRVNKGRIKPDYRVQPGDEIRIPPVRRSQEEEKRPPSERSVGTLSDRILYEDERIIIVNKPSGMAVHGGSGVSHGVIETMRHWRDELHFIELVHRLDLETSGCLILAKKRSALRQLHEMLREGDVEKRYLALVKGAWPHGKKRVEIALSKNVLRSGERMVNVSDDGKTAISTFRPLSIGKQATLMEIHIETGRTHQIRVHAAHLGHPIAGDDKYGDKEFNKEMRNLGLSRLFLHARSLAFTLEEPDKHIAVNAPLDGDLTQLLEKLGLHAK
jgi:23S rRNA pseudouridine955/2504/2580 synthase